MLRCFLVFWWIIAAFSNAGAQMSAGIAQRRADAESLRVEIDNVKPGEMPYVTYANLCKKVYQSDDADLIARCLGKEETGREMWIRLRQEQSPELQKRNALIVLRGGPGVWLEPEPPNYIFSGASDGARAGRVEYCLEILKLYLPQKIIDRHPLSGPQLSVSQQNRQQIADFLEKSPLLSENQSKPLDWRWVSAAVVGVLFLVGWGMKKPRLRHPSIFV